MPVTQPEKQLPTDKLLSAVAQLSEPELEQFAREVTALVARRKAPFLSHRETELLLKINEGIPTEIQKQFDALTLKKQEGTLAEDGYTELKRLAFQIEELDAKRIEYLAELANLRGITLTALMASLGITTPPYV